MHKTTHIHIINNNKKGSGLFSSTTKRRKKKRRKRLRRRSSRREEKSDRDLRRCRGLSHVLRYADSVGIVLRRAVLLQDCVREAEAFPVDW